MNIIIIISLIVAILAIAAIFYGIEEMTKWPDEFDISSFNMIFRYGIGAVNELNTNNETYTHNMVIPPHVTIEFKLSNDELEKIYQKMLEIGFFDYPTTFKVIPVEAYRIIATPFMSYYFKVQYDKKVKELSWEDEIHNPNSKAHKLRELINMIVQMINEKDEIKDLPTPRAAVI